MKQSILLISFLFTIVSFISCNGPIDSDSSISSFNYGTESDSARYYYLEGWKKIMDEGRWTKSELAFRKAAWNDDEFALGKALVARISRKIEEREKLISEIESMVTPQDEAVELLLAIYMNSVAFLNYRDRGVEITPEMRANKDSIAELNHKRFLNIHPYAIYEKAEYVEILHYKYGAQMAIDTLKKITDDKDKSIPFFVSYEAILEAELGNFGRSGILINKLDSLLDENAPARYFTRASVYKLMDSIAFAKAMAEQAYQLDTNHLLAKAMIDRLSDDKTRGRGEVEKEGKVK
ncbi:MAG: hypothetical protein HKN68_11455 [Saprospiraceae bacterium]|nr:hypothetical protein [Saprospiraceae bacterium]